MPNKTKNKQPRKTAIPRRKKKPTPFADVGQILGSAIGNMTGLGAAKGVGRWLGQGIGSIFGSGDYTMVGQSPSYNVLVNGKQIPKFESNDRTNIISHREYIGDVTSTQTFFNNAFDLNPSDTRTFPWLSRIAQNYQQYKFHGIIFEFRPLITDFVTGGQPGVVVFATNYNAAEPLYRNKVEMENSEFAVSVKPTMPLMHAIECASGETTISKLYVDRSANEPRFTDLGKVQFATQGWNSATPSLLGELWVSYCVEFFKPKLADDVGGAVTGHNLRTNFSDANPLGLINVKTIGDLPAFGVTQNTITFRGANSTMWLVTINWIGTTAQTLTVFNTTLNNCSLGPWVNNNGSNEILSPSVGISTTRQSYQCVVTSTATVQQQLCSITLSPVTGLPTGTTSLEVVVTQIDSSASP